MARQLHSSGFQAFRSWHSSPVINTVISTSKQALACARRGNGALQATLCPELYPRKAGRSAACLHLKSYYWKGLHLRVKGFIRLKREKDGDPKTHSTPPPHTHTLLCEPKGAICQAKQARQSLAVGLGLQKLAWCSLVRMQHLRLLPALSLRHLSPL